MKKNILLLFLVIKTFVVYGENFSLFGNYFPNLYSTIDVLNIHDTSITLNYEVDIDKKNIGYKIINKDGILFFKLSEKMPKNFHEEYYYDKQDLITNDEILILAGKEISKKDNILMFATTTGFEGVYPFIFPMFHFEVGRSYSDCSSFLKEETKEYPVENLDKYYVDSPWVEGVKGDGIGEGFTIKSKSVYPYLLIMNGYISYRKPYLYKQNNRIKKIKVTGVKSGKTAVLDVLDTPHPQTVDISFLNEPEDIRIEIADVYKGTKYDDTCLQFCVTYQNKVIPYENSIGE